MIRCLGLGTLHSLLEEEPRQSGLNWLAAKADYLDRNTTKIRKELTSSELSTQGGIVASSAYRQQQPREVRMAQKE